MFNQVIGVQPKVILDNGGCDIKVGFATTEEPLKVFPNAAAKVKGERTNVIADQILACEDISALSLKRPIDRGYVVNWDLQRSIWERTFRSVLYSSPAQSSGLVLTEPLSNLPAIQATMDQVLFEDMQVPSYLPQSAPALAMWGAAETLPAVPAAAVRSGLVVDCGFSFSHVAPVLDGRILAEGVRRINLGGKALTNYLKQLVSFRSINMMEETYLVEHIKEVACFVSLDLAADLAAAKAGRHSCSYVLPDGVSSGRGHLRPALTKEQLREAAREGKEVPALSLGNERFMVPELLFHPTDIGMDQAGLAEAICQAVDAVHPDLRPLLLSNVVCTGGTAKCPGFVERLSAELRPLVPSDIGVHVSAPPDPSILAWQGGAALGRSHEYERAAYTRAEYLERGSAHLRGDGPCEARPMRRHER